MAEKPLCPYFGPCGGCAHQDISYESELSLKEEELKQLFHVELGTRDDIFQPMIPSPDPYAYRSRLDLSLRRVRGKIIMGFNEEGTSRLIDIDSCAIARPEISRFIPALKQAAAERLPADYRTANLVVKTGSEGRIRWGGIGRKSLQLAEADYFWTEIEGKKIFYSLDTFFQANLSILPSVMGPLRSLLGLGPETHFFDLYAGVGLFWVVFAGEVKAVSAVEESGSAVRLAEFNRRHHGFSNVSLLEGKTEDLLEEILNNAGAGSRAALADPPRQGLSPRALEALTQAKSFQPLVYISCNPAALMRDLAAFLASGWKVDSVLPMDFFPKTKHLEVAVRLYPQV
jgi:tRNA/tmRNA/rRNA uracil-C5-methylase (TrmA/RlmC/RlmD family)